MVRVREGRSSRDLFRLSKVSQSFALECANLTPLVSVLLEQLLEVEKTALDRHLVVPDLATEPRFVRSVVVCAVVEICPSFRSGDQAKKMAEEV